MAVVPLQHFWTCHRGRIRKRAGCLRGRYFVKHNCGAQLGSWILAYNSRRDLGCTDHHATSHSDDGARSRGAGCCARRRFQVVSGGNCSRVPAWNWSNVGWALHGSARSWSVTPVPGRSCRACFPRNIFAKQRLFSAGISDVGKRANFLGLDLFWFGSNCISDVDEGTEVD